MFEWIRLKMDWPVQWVTSGSAHILRLWAIASHLPSNMFSHTLRLLLFHQTQAKSISHRVEWHKYYNAFDSRVELKKTAPNSDTSKIAYDFLFRLHCSILYLNLSKDSKCELWKSQRNVSKAPQRYTFFMAGNFHWISNNYGLLINKVILAFCN